MKSKFSNNLTVETARVIIAAVTKADLEKIFNQPELKQLNDSTVFLSIANADDQSVAGWIALDETDDNILIKYVWIQESFRGSRVFRETGFALLNFCLNVLKMQKVYALIPVENERAKAAFLKIAFIPASVRTQQPVTRDVEEFSLQKQEWPLRGVQFFSDLL
jgi:RimJ/RimL family protein N-acetyltransferase